MPLDEDAHLPDDRLRLIFTCCHPALSAEAQIALTLREVIGMTTEAIAQAFLIPLPTMAQRLVRAKHKIRDAKIPYAVPQPQELAPRLIQVLRVIYLIFNQAYSQEQKNELADNISRQSVYEAHQELHQGLSQEAQRLAQLLDELLPHAEVKGLRALMLFHEARRPARVNDAGELVSLEHQDRRLWCADNIQLGEQLLEQAFAQPPIGAYTLQAAISAVHLQAMTYQETDWKQIVGLYQALLAQENSSVIQLNYAVAVSMAYGHAMGLAHLHSLTEQKEMQQYYLFFATKAELLKQSGQYSEAITHYQKAISLAPQEASKRFLQQKLEEIQAKY